MSQPLNPEQREDLRHATLEALVVRHPTAHTARAIRRVLAREVPFPFTDEDLLSALAFQVGAARAVESVDPQGSTKFWAATSEGVPRA